MITTYFPKAKISMIKVDKHLLKKTDYDVKLVNGTKIESTILENGHPSTAKRRVSPMNSCLNISAEKWLRVILMLL